MPPDSAPPTTAHIPPVAVEARRALATRDRAAIARIAHELGPMLRGVVRRILARRGLPLDLEEDLLQDIFVSLLKDDCAALADWDPDRGTLDAYLRFYARSRAIDQLRRRRDVAVDERRLSAAVERDRPPAAEGAWLDDALGRYRAECTEEDWRFLLAVVEGRETAELESVFALSTAAVYKRKQRLRDRLLEIRRMSTEKPAEGGA